MREPRVVSDVAEYAAIRVAQATAEHADDCLYGKSGRDVSGCEGTYPCTCGLVIE